MGKLEIYGAVASPPVRATLITAKAIGVPHELKELDPHNKTEQLKKLNPQQQIPVLVDDGFALGESRAIMQYLVDKYAKDDSLYPKDLQARALVNARLNFDCGTLWPKIVSFVKQGFAEGKVTKEGLKNLRDSVEVVEEFLSRNKWIAGPTLTLADISFSTILSALNASGFDMSPFPKVSKWLEECRTNIPNYSINDEGIAKTQDRFDKMKEMIKNAE